MCIRDRHYWRTEFGASPAPWLPHFLVFANAGRITDYASGVVRPGLELIAALSARPLPALELESRVSLSQLKREGKRTYREVGSQLLGVYHFDARQSLRTIVQRTTLDRRSEPGVAAARAASTTTSLTYAFRRSMGTCLYIGATTLRDGLETARRGTESFIKLQADFDEVRGMY